MATFRKLTIQFETSAQLPPPYSYRYVLRILPNEQSINVDLKLTYTHRDELDADEIEAEGFTDNDDYEWKGALEKVWSDELEKVLKKTQMGGSMLQDEEFDFLTLEWETDTTKKGQPKNTEDWLYFAQELLQAIYETSEKERPFEMQVIDATSQGTREAQLTASFRTRTAQVKRVVDGKTSLRFYPWQELPSLMETVYAPNWLTDNASSQKPKRNGLYFNLGDGVWYEWGKQVVEPGKGAKTLSKLKDVVTTLFA
ncbi:hypothetical protein [Runella limosa]|uniref:hypothetical protein n=1 Tax=Runella limosa TaxID=370978 RepID=UPI00040C3A63|nr:hypothetical protein [Runella limosa]